MELKVMTTTARKTTKKAAIPFLTGRPERLTVIGADDIANLIIALETAKTFEEFIAMV